MRMWHQVLDDKFVFKNTLEVNSLNKRGLTLLDGGDCEIEEMLKKVGGSRFEEINLFSQQPTNSSPHSEPTSRGLLPRQSGQEQSQGRPKRPSKRLQEYFKYDKIKESPTEVRSILLVVAVLIATATYQAVLSPPGGVWQEDLWPSANMNSTNNSSIKRSPLHRAGHAILYTESRVSFCLFLVFNSIGFFMSLHMINFLTLGLPLQLELRVSIVALTATYDTCMIAITPNGNIYLFFTVFSIVTRFMMPVFTKVVRDYGKQRRCALPSTRAGT